MDVRELTEDELVHRVDMSAQTQFQAPFLLEMQRRSIIVQRESIAIAQRLIVAIQASGDCAAAQTDQVINLTRALKVYTIVLAVIGVVQIALMLWKG